MKRRVPATLLHYPKKNAGLCGPLFDELDILAFSCLDVPVMFFFQNRFPEYEKPTIFLVRVTIFQKNGLSKVQINTFY